MVPNNPMNRLICVRGPTFHPGLPIRPFAAETKISGVRCAMMEDNFVFECVLLQVVVVVDILWYVHNM